MKTSTKAIMATAMMMSLAFAGITLVGDKINADFEGDWIYSITGNSATIEGYIGSGGEVTIPSSLGGKTVTSIGDDAFSNRTKVTSVTIPTSVTSISSGAFRVCTGLTSVTIPTSVTSIGDGAFQGCTGLTSVTIPTTVTSIGDDAFNGCTGLTSVTIPTSVTSIGSGAFRVCTGLTSVTIPTSVTSIGVYAFGDCTGLTSVTIPTSVTSIDYGVFNGCTGLTSVTIPESVTSIKGDAFEGCTNLSIAYVPSNTTIQSNSFPSTTQIIRYSGADITSEPGNPIIIIGSSYLYTVITTDSNAVITKVSGPDWITVSGKNVFGDPPAIGTYDVTIKSQMGTDGPSDTQSWIIIVKSEATFTSSPSAGYITEVGE